MRIQGTQGDMGLWILMGATVFSVSEPQEDCAVSALSTGREAGIKVVRENAEFWRPHSSGADKTGHVEVGTSFQGHLDVFC